MADKKISDFTSAGSVAAADLLEIETAGGNSRKVTGATLQAYVNNASPTEQLTGTESVKGSTPDSIAALWEQGADVASAGTTSLGEGGYFNITGTTTITDIDFATDKAGRAAWVKFAGILTLTHNASTLILPTAANITTAAGDTACFVSEGSDVVRCVAYNRASGAALTGGGLTAPTIRGDAAQSFASAATFNVTLPTGSTAGDTLIVVGGCGFSFNLPTGCFQIANDVGSNFNGIVFKKTLVAGDITNGYITVTTTGSFNAVFNSIAFVGAVNITGATTFRDGGGFTGTGYLISKRVRPSETYIMVGQGRAAINVTQNGTTQLNTVNATSASGSMYKNLPSVEACIESTYTFSGTPTGYYVAQFSVCG